MGIFSKLFNGLKKTRDSVVSGWKKLLGSFTKIDEELFEQLEETMIMGDMGAQTAVEICDQLRDRVKERGITDPNEIMGLIQEIIAEMMGEDEGLDLSTKPSVILVIGVNGAGKTTTIGKLCHQLKAQGKRVLVAAADTFRAAAIDQLAVWTERSDTELVRHAEGSDPAAVVFDAIEAAKARGCDVVICDTAGRLHNKKNLMAELAKINRVIDREAGECARECLLVLDATTGQNAVNQARLFQEAAPLTGIVLTKLDGTAKGGIVISIRHELGIPVKLIGVGEGIDDLQPFESKSFVEALFDTSYVPEDEDEADSDALASEETDAEYDDEYDEADDEKFDGKSAEELTEEEFSEESEEEISGEEAAVEPDADDTEESVKESEDEAEDDSELEKEEAESVEETAVEPAEPAEEPKKKRGLFGWFRKS